MNGIKIYEVHISAVLNNFKSVVSIVITGFCGRNNKFDEFNVLILKKKS